MLWQIGIFGPGGLDPTTLKPDTAFQVVLRGFEIALSLIGGIAVLYILVAGLQYIMAAGNDGKQAEAKKTITYAIVGFFLVIVSFAIVNEVLHRIEFNDTILKDNPAVQKVIK